MLNNGTKIVSIRNNGSIIKSGDIFYVTEVTKDGDVFYESEDGKQHGCVSGNMFDKYFDVVEVKPETKPKTFQTKITGSDVDDLLERSKFITDSVFDKCTIVSCQLPNGFVIVETSSCVDPDNYDEDLGVEVCMKRIKDRVWELEGYLLQNNIYLYNEIINGPHSGFVCDDVCDDSDDLCCDGDCFNCPEFDDGENDKQENRYDDYWDHVADAYDDFLDWVDDYFDDIAERDQHYRGL